MGEEKPRADLEKRVIQLEELYSHQQHLVQQLDEELVKLRSVIEKLEIGRAHVLTPVTQ